PTPSSSPKTLSMQIGFGGVALGSSATSGAPVVGSTLPPPEKLAIPSEPLPRLAAATKLPSQPPEAGLNDLPPIRHLPRRWLHASPTPDGMVRSVPNGLSAEPMPVSSTRFTERLQMPLVAG